MADLSIAATLCYYLAKSRGTHYIRFDFSEVCGAGLSHHMIQDKLTCDFAHAIHDSNRTLRSVRAPNI